MRAPHFHARAFKTVKTMNQELDYQELLFLIYQYYPQNISPYDSLYYSSKEWHALEGLYNKGEPYTQARGLVEHCEIIFPNEIMNNGQIHPYPSYNFFIKSEQTDNIVTGYDVHISFICPYYCIYKSVYYSRTGRAKDDFEMKNLSSEEKQLLKKIEQTIQIYMPQYSAIDVSLAFQTVPMVAFESKTFGEVTIFDCLFNRKLD